ncbi:MAG TPA: site-specific DNA-methyltransferase [Solirubrobacteraceae bacterium]|nr:site-specific DNA-methyltransferase [Solirubrobacteraceae bacterium]
MRDHEAICGDAVELLADVPAGSVDLIYLDPPFGTGSTRRARQRHTGAKAHFEDPSLSAHAYVDWLRSLLTPALLTLKPSGALFVHCDWRASHHIRVLLDELLGTASFRNEIIWHYRRWTAASASLQRLHQTIYYYARSPTHAPAIPLIPYSPTTNLEQIWQARTRSAEQVSVYAREGAQPRNAGAKRGVPLGDVWEIPPLNPKARERVGYPTQKPLALLERIVAIASPAGGLVLDPCCGSGTTLVAAKLLGRRALGFDTASLAIELTRRRLAAPVRSTSEVIDGRDAFRRRSSSADHEATLALLRAHAVQRSSVIHGYLSPAGLDRLGLPCTWSVPLALVEGDAAQVSEHTRALAALVASKRAHAGLVLARPWQAARGAQRPTGRVVQAPWPADECELDAVGNAARYLVQADPNVVQRT